MSTLDLLLGLDPEKMKRPTKSVEINRLSKLAGDKVVFEIQALTLDEEQEARENATKGEEVDIVSFRIFQVMKGVTSPDLKDKGLLDKYGAATPKDLLKTGKLLQPGEVVSLYNEISGLSGYGDDAVSDLKNE